ncbi:hypothetical protein PVAND_002718 [Polypedilum vanderplanki]|uniref:Uncharacterized protein n=1 Tax=Polypedilum vanderplanki TaxID=319348 RepID=A0A9J6BSZ7_POLVA|nr:hypothetical protein PVAND_002718 [Polypedilum vanderplanki]
MGSGNDMNNGAAKSGTGVWSSDGHGYCLRWNNHKSNLVEILEALIKMECYVDCTIYVDNHVQFKAHRVVLAACSPYFQAILQDAPQDHCSIIFPGVQEFEMRTLLEYIYAGEVNIAESQIPRIMKIAKMLEVKGLLDMVDLTSNISQQQQQPISAPPNLFRQESHASILSENKRDNQTSSFPLHHPLTHSSPIISTSTKISSAQSSSSPPYNYKSSPYVASLYSQSPSGARDLIAGPGMPNQEMGDDERGRNWPPPLPLSLARSAQSMLSSVYETGSDMNPLKRKKLSSINSMLMTRDTPILRNVLAQSNAADSSQGGVHPQNANSPTRGDLSNRNDGNGNGSDNIENNDTNNNENNGNNAGNASGGNNGSVYVSYVRKSGDRSYHSSNGSDNSDKKYKDEEPSSPLTERSFDDESMNDSRQRVSPPEFDMRIPAYLQQQAQFHQAQYQHQSGGQGSGSSSQKPEWKRYKQYTRNDIMSAIECVRNGMSALQASRKFGVPSRTLYDKVKKLGITTGTPRNRSSSSKRDPGPSSSSAAFPYGSLSGAAGAFLYPNQDNQLSQSQDFDSELENELKIHRPNPHAGLLDPVFLQKLAQEARSDEFRGDALHAMALAAAAHAQFNGMGSTSRSHDSPSASVLSKFMNRHSESIEMERERLDRERSRSNGDQTSLIKNEPVDDSDEDMEKAENLSLSKCESPPNITPPPQAQTPPSFEARGVIVPPMKYTSSPRSEPSSTTPPSISEQALSLEKSECKQQSFNNDAPIALTPTTTANYDD